MINKLRFDPHLAQQRIASLLEDHTRPLPRVHGNQFAIQFDLPDSQLPLLLSERGGHSWRMILADGAISGPVVALLEAPPIAPRSLDRVVFACAHHALDAVTRNRLFAAAFSWLRGGGTALVVGARRFGPYQCTRTWLELRAAGFLAPQSFPLIASQGVRNILRGRRPGALAVLSAGHVLVAAKPEDPDTIIDARRVFNRRRPAMGKPVATRTLRVDDGR